MIDNKRFDKPKQYDQDKAKLLCYASLYPSYDDERLKKVIGSKRMSYKPFLNYLKLAEQAARSKQNIGAKFVVVDRDNDYKLSCWINVKVLSKEINNTIVSDLSFVEQAMTFGFQ